MLRGRAEVLRNSCTELHLDGRSTLRMVANGLKRVELVAGVRLTNTRVYRFDSGPAHLMVSAGMAAVEGAGKLRAGRG